MGCRVVKSFKFTTPVVSYAKVRALVGKEWVPEFWSKNFWQTQMRQRT